jgi:hypothetical protein
MRLQELEAGMVQGMVVQSSRVTTETCILQDEARTKNTTTIIIKDNIFHFATSILSDKRQLSNVLGH